ncbi:hypothetical protein DWUX_660 [Desulfovibrio diazotrophicus]|nr:hypothetical protein DWUX_660 [Desulfovibrio diazotrophicus]VVU43103.1 hypothetical protein DWUX_449 [Desulfovibrio diazotrophicus]
MTLPPAARTIRASPAPHSRIPADAPLLEQIAFENRYSQRLRHARSGA